MTNRQGRRRRSRRHKARAKSHWIRLRSALWIGREHSALNQFKALCHKGSCAALFVGGPLHGEVRQVDGDTCTVALMPPLPSYREFAEAVGAATSVRHTTYTRQRRCFSRSFFLGTVTVTIDLRPVMAIKAQDPVMHRMHQDELLAVSLCSPQL